MKAHTFEIANKIVRQAGNSRVLILLLVDPINGEQTTYQISELHAPEKFQMLFNAEVGSTIEDLIVTMPLKINHVEALKLIAERKKAKEKSRESTNKLVYMDMARKGQPLRQISKTRIASHTIAYSHDLGMSYVTGKMYRNMPFDLIEGVCRTQVMHP